MDELPPLPQIPPDGKRCNARKTKRHKREYCSQHPYAKGKGRCYWHGGTTPSGLVKELTMGERANYLPPELRARFENLNGDAIDGLEESIRMQGAFETRLLDQLSTGESHQAWKLINELIPQYEYADADTKDAIMNRIKQIAQGGLKAYGVQKEIFDLHERSRKLTETLVKCRKEVQETWTAEQWGEMVSVLLRILKQELDTDVLRRVALSIQSSHLLPEARAMEAKVIKNERVVESIPKKQSRETNEERRETSIRGTTESVRADTEATGDANGGG